MKKKIRVTSRDINTEFNFEDIESCRDFLNNLLVEGMPILHFELSDGTSIRIKDIPDDQMIQRAKEIRRVLKP